MESSLKTLLELASKKFNKDIHMLSAKQDVFESLGINSVEALALLSDLERHFQIEIPDYELQDVKSFNDLATLIDSKR